MFPPWVTKNMVTPMEFKGEGAVVAIFPPCMDGELKWLPHP